jgi:hypothetical protein
MWLFGLIFPYVGGVRASRLSARMVERAYRDLEAVGYSRSTLRTLHLILDKAFRNSSAGIWACTSRGRAITSGRSERSRKRSGSVTMSGVTVCTRCGGC